MKLRSKLLLLVIPLAIIPIIIAGWLGNAQLQTSSETLSTQQIKVSITQLANRLEAHLKAAESNVSLFAESTLLASFARENDLESRYALLLPAVLRELRTFINAYDEYYEIRFLWPNGFEDARASKRNLPNAFYDESETEFFKFLKASGNEVVSRIIKDPDTDELSIQIGKPIFREDRLSADSDSGIPLLKGYLIVSSSPEFFLSELNTIAASSLGDIYASDSYGQIIFHPDQSKIGSSIGNTIFEKLINVTEGFSFNYNLPDRVINIFQVHPDLTLIGELDKKTILPDSAELQKTLAKVVVVSSLLLIFLLLLVVQLILVRPLKSLIRGVESVAKGEPSNHLDTNRSDEIGVLANSFTNMERKLLSSRREIETLAYEDRLTGLPNRIRFFKLLAQEIEETRSENFSFALLYLDLDNFKRVNDTLGHDIGDALLVKVAKRLKLVLSENDWNETPTNSESKTLLARLGGDEFIVLLRDLTEPTEVVNLAEVIIEAMSFPCKVGELELVMNVSIGIATYPGDGEDVSTLARKADTAMYHAKEQGKNNYQFFSSDRGLVISKNLATERLLRRAIENNEFEVFYQPQVDPDSAEIKGFEALIRWRDPERGLIGPVDFIPVAEDTGLINPIGEWILNEACRQTEAWRKQGLGKLFISVNLSGIQLQTQNVSALVRDALRASKLPPEFLELEVTESILINLNDDDINELFSIQARGTSISLDDFGTGYSSLSRLRNLPIDKLKIDQSFVADMLDDSKAEAIVLAVMFIAQSLDLKTTAEGIETEPQRQLLLDHRCDYLQGYLFSRPVPAEEATQMLVEQNSAG